MDSITRKRKLDTEIPPISSETTETPDETSMTPREFHAPIIPFTKRVDDLLDMFQENLKSIETLMTEYIKKHCNPDNDFCQAIRERREVIITLESDLENGKIAIYNTNPSDEELQVFVNTWFHKILEILRDNQPYINDIQLTLSSNKNSVRYNLYLYQKIQQMEDIY